MKMKILVGALVFLILMNLATIGTYLYFRFTRHSDRNLISAPPGRGAKVLADMSEDQREQLFDLMQDFHAGTRNLREQANSLEEETLELLQEDSVRREAVDESLKRMAEIRLEIGGKAVEKLIEAKAFLPPVQLERLFRGMLQMRPGPPGESPPGTRWPRRDRMGFGPPGPPPDEMPRRERRN